MDKWRFDDDDDDDDDGGSSMFDMHLHEKKHHDLKVQISTLEAVLILRR